MFKKISVFMILVLLGSFNSSLYAEPHSHGSRSHNHPLPQQGVGHRHGNGVIGKSSNYKKQRSNLKAGFVPSNNNIRSIIIGGISYQNNKFKDIYTWNEAVNYCNNLNGSRWKLPTVNQLKKVFSKKLNQSEDGTKYYIKKDFVNNMSPSSSFWTSTKNVYGTFDWNFGRVTPGFTRLKRSSPRLSAMCVTGNNPEDQKWHGIEVDTPVVFRKFIDRYNLYNIKGAYHPYVIGWFPKNNNYHNFDAVKDHHFDVVKDSDITGSGYIRIGIMGSVSNEVKIFGNFKNGKLVSSGKLEVAEGVCASGIYDCKVISKTISISSSSNLRKLIDGAEKVVALDAKKTLSALRVEIASRSNNYSSQLDYVMAEFSSTCGLVLCSDKNLKISGGPGRFSPTYSGAATGAIYKGYNGLAGQYNWSAQLDNTVCSGSFYLTGRKRNLYLDVYKNCSDAGSREY